MRASRRLRGVHPQHVIAALVAATHHTAPSGCVIDHFVVDHRDKRGDDVDGGMDRAEFSGVERAAHDIVTGAGLETVPGPALLQDRVNDKGQDPG